jgi:DNA repair exonuclease SbcCD ATPase subunit|nr:MAG TPA: chromosome partition protein [Caudoviricetes sp.]
MRATLKRVVLENFMCYAHADFDFYAITKITAKNGKGKSTIATAYLWCLFNCDYELKDNPVVRREIDGVSVDDMDTSVELTLDVDGKEITMKKVQKRTYEEIIKDGVVITTVKDPNSYYINSVSKTLKAFNEYLDVNMNIFKMCSNINVFLTQKPKEMRECLLSLVKKTTDLDMAKSKSELAELVPLLEKYTYEEIRAMKNKIKKDVDDNAKKLKGQIEEKERDIQIKQGIDLSDLELQKNSLKVQIADCVAKQTDNDKLMAEYDKASSDILNLKFELSDMSRKANEDNVKTRRDIENKISEKKDYLINIANTIQKNNSEISGYQNDIESGTRERSRLADVWNEIKEEKFDENTAVCPTCHRELPTEEIESLRSSFEKTKADRLAKVEKDGLEVKADIDNARDMIPKLEECSKDNIANQKKLEKEVTDLEKQLSELPQEIDVTATEEYKALEQQIAEKEQTMHKANDISAVKAELKAQETALRQQLAECESKIAKSDTAADEQRLEELKQTRIDSEQNKANAEKILDLLDELDKAKNEALTETVNSHFRLVKWQLFEYAKNGNYKSCCIPTVDGKSILTTMSNKGNRILGRVDICNSIQKISGISVPIILDDSESLSTDNQKKVAEMVDSQLIMLIVNDSEKLEIMEG